jgi:hypothetical protein
MPSKERGGVSIIVGDGRQRIDAVGDRRTVDHRSGVQCTAHRAALVLSSLCDDHHEKALFSTELRKKNRAFLTAPGLAGISSELMQSHWTKRFKQGEQKCLVLVRPPGLWLSYSFLASPRLF